MLQEVHADLFTKGVAVVSILMRNEIHPLKAELPPVLYVEGFRALIEFSWRLSGKPDGGRSNPLFEHVLNDGYRESASRTHWQKPLSSILTRKSICGG